MPELSPLGCLLHDEHFEIAAWLNQLKKRVSEEGAERLPDMANSGDRQELHRLSWSLEQVLLHHAFEEKRLFPCLTGAEGAGLAKYLARDHATIEPTVLRLHGLTGQMLNHGICYQSWVGFCDQVLELHREMISHLVLEELLLLQRLPMLIDDDVDRELALRHSIGGLLLIEIDRAVKLH